MLSIVPLIAGGGLFETGAGGSAPKHVQQFLEEDYLRWDSSASSSPWACRSSIWPRPTGTPRLRCSPTPSIGPTARSSSTTARRRAQGGEIDNRGSHFYLALYWAQALAAADQGQGPASPLQAAGRGSREERGEGQRRTYRRARKAGRYGRLLPPRFRQDVRGDAAQRHIERSVSRAVTLRFALRPNQGSGSRQGGAGARRDRPHRSDQRGARSRSCRWRFIAQQRNAVFISGTGTGKTQAVTAITRSCIRAGRRGRFFTTVDLVNQLEAETRAGARAASPTISPVRTSSSPTNSATCRSPRPAANSSSTSPAGSTSAPRSWSPPISISANGRACSATRR